MPKLESIAALLFPALLFALSAPSALAQYPGAPPGAPGNLQQVQASLRQIDADIQRFERDAKADMQKSPDWAEAQRAASAATQDRDKARTAALGNIRASEPYVAAAEKLAKSEKIIADGNRRQASARQVTTATSDAIDARLAIAEMEKDALSKSAEFQDADMRLSGANARLKELWEARRQDEMANNRAYRASLANKQVAEQQLKAAQEAARIARQQMAAQQQAARPQRAQRTPRSSGGGGGGSMGGGGRRY